MNVEEIGKLIGNTPIIRISCMYNGMVKNVFAKLEWYNFSGSIKDRAAYYIIKNAIESGKLKTGQPIIEATSGNMGISIAAIGGALGYPVHIFMPDWMSSERKQILKNYGAVLHEVSRKEGGFLAAISMANALAEEIDGFRSNQFENSYNVKAHYESTGKEIISKMKNIHIDAFVSGIGTGGTLMGVSTALKEYDENIKTYAFEPDSLSVILLGDTEGKHKIEGIGDEFIPKIVDRKKIDKLMLINDDDAINMARILAKNGLGVGISSGGNFLASVLFNEDDKNIVTVFPDDNKKYLSTDLRLEIDENKNLFSNSIELLGFEVI